MTRPQCLVYYLKYHSSVVRILPVLFFLLISHLLCGQLKVHVNTPVMPGLNLNDARKNIKGQFRQIRKDSIAALDNRARELEQQLKGLEAIDTSLAFTDSLRAVEGDTALLQDTARLSLDTLYDQVAAQPLVKAKLQKELDSINQLKSMIRWDSLQEAYLASEMKKYFQSKGILPSESSENAVADLQKKLAGDLPSMHLDPESFKTKEALAKEAAKQLEKMKAKYLKVDDLRYPEKGVKKPKPYNTFTDRIILGGQININLTQKPNIVCEPNFGLILLPGVRWSVEYNATYFMLPQVRFLERNTSITPKLGSYVDVDITRGLFVRGKVQKPVDTRLREVSDLYFLVGLGKTLTLRKNLKAQIVLNYSFEPQENGKRWFLEYGIQQRGISDLFRKKK